MAKASTSQRPKTPASGVKRPLSPHLSIYKPQLTSGLSIFHKITGVSLCGLLVVIVSWLACLAWAPQWHDYFVLAATSWIGRLFLIGWTWAFFYHFGVGVRYLFWAAAWGMSLKDIYRWGYVALAFSFLATGGLWAVILSGGLS